MHTQARKSSFKTPPTDKEVSQHFRRAKALEGQKQRRAQCVDSSRNLDIFAGLSLEADDDGEPEIIHGGMAQFVSLLPSSDTPEATMDTHLSNNKLRRLRKSDAHFANRIMYAELLEMKDDQMLTFDGTGEGIESDGLPADLDTKWVALAPVPQGKRCMAVSNQSLGIPGTVPNTFLKSRLKGRTILTFPSPLPPSTAMDCILDKNWKSNGILHVLDLIRWKGHEVGDCEANFRFWWRDTRLSELVSLPSLSCISQVSSTPAPSVLQAQHVFAHPNVFLPVPYHLDLSYTTLRSTIVPLSRSLRSLMIQLPSRPEVPEFSEGADGKMDADQPYMWTETATAEIEADGLLLYVSQASYEPGTSPLSSWVPIKANGDDIESPLTRFERLVSRRALSLSEK